MKYLVQIVFLFCPFLIFSQTQSEILKQISMSETVVFKAESSGCFNAGTNTYKLVRLKNKERKITGTVEKKAISKKISAKNYEAFIKRYEASLKRFSDPDEKQLCTTTSNFELSNKKQTLKFTNGSCQGEFNPEEFLLQLLK